jgi:hypothetical protein
MGTPHFMGLVRTQKIAIGSCCLKRRKLTFFLPVWGTDDEELFHFVQLLITIEIKADGSQLWTLHCMHQLPVESSRLMTDVDQVKI